MNEGLNLTLEKFNSEKELNDQRMLFKECFPENIGTSVETQEHYSWKFHSFPSTPPSYEYIAKSGEDMLGYYAALPYPYDVYGERVSVGMVCDVMTGIKARGKGVFTKLGIYSTNELGKENIDFTTGYPIRPEVIPGHLKAGWEKIFELPLYISFLKFNSVLNKKSIGFLSFLPNFIIKLFHLLKIAKSGDTDIASELFTNKDIKTISGLDEFLHEWRKEKSIVLEKSIPFLSWRLNAPGKEYEINVLRDKTRIVGLAVTRFIIKEGIPSLAILDFMVLKNIYSDALHKVVYSRANDLGAEAILVMASRTDAKRLNLFKNGFLKSPFKFTLIIKKLKMNIADDKLKDEENWHLMWIDSDDL